MANETADSLSATSPGNERRAWVRFPCDLGTSLVATASDEPTRWSARMQDISQGGMRLTVHRRFESGTILNIQVEATSEGEVQTVILARVMHVSALPDGHWNLGCRFARELSEKDLEALLKRA